MCGHWAGGVRGHKGGVTHADLSLLLTTPTPRIVSWSWVLRHVGDVHLSRQYYLSSNWVAVFRNHIIMDFSKDCEGFINHNMCVSAMYCKKDFWDHSDALRHMEMAHNTTGVSIPNPNPLWPERQEHYCPFCDPVIMFNSLHCVLLLNCCRKKNIIKHRLHVCSWSWILASHSHHWEHRPVSLLMAGMPPYCSPVHPPLSRQCFHQNGSENTSEHINNEIYGRRGQSDRFPWLIATQNHFNFWLESFHLHKYFINIFYCPDPNALNHRTDKSVSVFIL